MLEPLVSVIVPCYNSTEILKKTLFSVAMQQYSNFEVIIVDDGSTDSTPEIIRQFENWDHRFKGVRQENRGVSAARNNGVEVARGNYIAFLDSDDLFLKDALPGRMRVLIEEDDTNMVGVFCPAVLIDLDGNVLCSTRHFDYQLPDDRLYFSTSPDSVFNPSCVIAKKIEILKADGFDESIDHGEDYDLWHKMMRRGGYFKKVRSCSIGWRQHSLSAAHSKILRHYNQCKSVTRRIFSESLYDSSEEFRGGFGESLYFLSITKRAFGASIMAVVSRQYEDAMEISADIKKSMLEQIALERLEEMIKFNALRALSQPEEEWRLSVWPKIQKEIIHFITELNESLGGDCNSLSVLKFKLENEGISTFGMNEEKTSFLEGQTEWQK